MGASFFRKALSFAGDVKSNITLRRYPLQMKLAAQKTNVAQLIETAAPRLRYLLRERGTKSSVACS